MPITSILKRATSYILGNGEEGSADDFNYEDNEILFCKNNVCVHPPLPVRDPDSDLQHFSGYLTLCTKTFIDQHNLVKRPTLLLSWIPNSTLRKCPTELENCSPMHHPKTAITLQKKGVSLREEDEDIQQKEHKDNQNNNIQIQMINTTNPFLENYVDPEELAAQQQQNSTQPSDSKSMNFSDYSETISISSSSDHVNDCNCYTNTAASTVLPLAQQEKPPTYIEEDEGIIDSTHDDNLPINDDEKNDEKEEEERVLKAELEPLLDEDDEQLDSHVKVLSRQVSAPVSKSAAAHLLKNLKQHQSMTSVNITIANPHVENMDVSGAPEMVNDHNTKQIMRSLSISSVDENNPNFMTAEMFAYKNNLIFPDSVNASPIATRKQNQLPLKLRRFSVDLSQMRSLRLFFNDEQCTSGQLVIASRESQYKILHFHHGGLDHLAQVLHQWHCLLHNIKVTPGIDDSANLPYRQFMVCRPEVRKGELHPEEGKVPKITTEYFYGQVLNEKGQIEDDLQLRKCVFFGGLEKNLRKTVWPFLLHCYSTSSTFNDRVALAELRKQEYDEITRRRLYSMSPEEQAKFWRNVQCVIEKDVVRTDRGNPYFAGEGNPNIETMKNILLNYAFYNSGIG